MEKFTHITTSVPTTISINGQNTYTLSTPRLKWVDVLHKKDIFVSFLPNDSCYLPTTINTRLNNTDNVEIIPYINNHQEIIYTPSKIICDKKDVVLYEKTIDNLYIKILSNEKNYVNISHPTKGELLNKVIPSLLTITDEINNYVYIKGITKENYIQLIDYIINETDMNVALIPHVVWENNDDRKPLKELYDLFKHTQRVCLIDDHNCMELKGFISRCRFFVGARTHATIAAYSTCVPTLVVGYSVKAKGIAKDIFGTYDHYVLPVQSLNEKDDLVKSFQWLVNHETDIKNHLHDFMPSYKEKALEAGNKLKELFDI